MTEATGNNPRKNNVLITVSCGTNNPNRSVRAIHLVPATKMWELACKSTTISL